MKTMAFTLGCGIVALFTAGIAILSTVLLLNRPGNISYTNTPATRVGRIVLFTPAPIPFTPQPVISFSTVTPSSSPITVPPATPTFAATPTSTPIPATPTPTVQTVTETSSQAETSSLTTASGTMLPDRRPEALGPLSKREGNSIFVSGASTIEIVVTEDTAIYRDKTEMPQPGGPGVPGGAPPGDMSPPSNMAPPSENGISPGDPSTFQMEIERVDSLDEISGQVMILAWGESQDSRVIAQILVYRLIE